MGRLLKNGRRRREVRPVDLKLISRERKSKARVRVEVEIKGDKNSKKIYGLRVFKKKIKQTETFVITKTIIGKESIN